MTKDHLEYKGHEITIVDDKESDESAEVIIDSAGERHTGNGMGSRVAVIFAVLSTLRW